MSLFRKDKSWVNKLIFPAPKPPGYDANTFDSMGHHFQLVWLPRRQAARRRQDDAPHEANSVPCLVVPFPGGSSRVIIYCHGNAEDLGGLPSMLMKMSRAMRCHVIGMEYPGYGISQGQPSESGLNNDLLVVLSFLRGVMGWPARDIILYGFSIGTGPTCQLASRKRVGGLCLIAPYTSIRDMVVEALPKGVGSVGQYLVSNRFVNIEAIKNVRCPTLIIHGKSDRIIPHSHGEELFKKCGAVNKKLASVVGMDHCFSEYEFKNCVLVPMVDFFRLGQARTDMQRRFDLPPYVYRKPANPAGDPLPVTPGNDSYLYAGVIGAAVLVIARHYGR